MERLKLRQTSKLIDSLEPVERCLVLSSYWQKIQSAQRHGAKDIVISAGFHSRRQKDKSPSLISPIVMSYTPRRDKVLVCNATIVRQFQ